MSRRLDLAYTTLAAELLERALDAQFDQDFDAAGSFVKAKVKERDYWYYQPSRRDGEARRRYVGPAEDEAITRRVDAFRQDKADYQARRKIVSTLVRDARLFQPEQRVGAVVDAFWKAGLFRLRACLVGTIAFQTFGTVLGYRMPGGALQTGDIDFAQFHSIAVSVEDSLPPVLDILRAIDPEFWPAPTLNDQAGAAAFLGAGGLRVEFLTPNRGSDDLSGGLSSMPALGGTKAIPLRFLDFLIHEPVRTVMLHGAGIPVLVPDPARYAVHKLIVSSRRAGGTGKDVKDLRQADALAAAYGELGREPEIVDAFAEARERGLAWREAIDASISRMNALGLPAMPALAKRA